MTGFHGASVLEIICDHRGDTYRAVYTVRYEDAIWVVHAFQKKSKQGIATPPRDMNIIRRRLADLEREYAMKRKGTKP